MGKVFSPEQVSNGQVPELGAQQHAARFVLDTLFTPIEDGQYLGIEGVDSALAYGSTTFAPKRRSDVDLLIVYDPQQADTALPFIQQTLEEAERRYKVPIEANVLFAGALNGPLEHGVDTLFLRHLASVQEYQPQWRRNRPIPDGALTPLDKSRVIDVAIAYCSGKVRQFARALTERDPNLDLHALQRAFELPGAIGRKALAATLDLDSPDAPEIEVRAIVDKTWATEQVAEQLRKFAGDHDDAVVKLGRLAALNNEYSRVLDATIQGEISLADYAIWLESNRRPALLLGHDVCYRWVELLRPLAKTSTSGTVAVPLADYTMKGRGY